MRDHGKWWPWEVVALCGICCVLLGLNGTLLILNNPEAKPTSDWGIQSAGDMPRSKAGEFICSLTSDPVMSTQQESEIIEFLQEYDADSWAGWTIADLASILGESIPVQLERYELEALGVSLDVPIEGMNISAGNRYTRIKQALEPWDLAMELRGGQLVITSLDGAECRPMVRVYDVGPLVEYSRSNINGFAELVNAIEQSIEPDSWLNAGGTQAITPLSTPGRNLMVVAATTDTQLQIASFLDVLNATSEKTFGFYSKSSRSEPLAAPPQPSSFMGGMGCSVGFF